MPAAAGTVPTPDPSALYVALKEEINGLKDTDADFKEYKEPRGRTSSHLYWWQRFADEKKWALHFESLMRFKSIVDFFSSFDADAYVISGNYVHKHPDADTVVGLAVTRSTKAAGSALYFTEPHTISGSDIQSVCTNFGYNVTTLFNGTSKLAVKSLRRDYFYFTLNANQAAPVNGRDVGHRTDVLNFNNPINGATVWGDLEADKTLLPERRTIAPANALFYYGLSTANGTDYYLDFSTGVPIVTQAQTTISFQIYDWTDSPDATNTGVAYGQIRVVYTPDVPGQTIITDMTVTGYSAAGGKSSWKLTWDEAGTWYTFCTNGNTVQEQQLNTALANSVSYFEVPHDTTTTVLSLRPHLAATPTLRDYCTALGVTIGTPLTCADALLALLGSLLMQLNLTLDFQLAILGFDIDPDTSTVAFSDTGLALPYNSAQLTFDLTSSDTIPFGSQNVPVKSVSITITWPANTTDASSPFTFVLNISSAQGITINQNIPLSNVSRTTPLRKRFLGMSSTPDALTTLQLPKIIDFLTNQRMFFYQALLMPVPAVLMQNGLATLYPDLDASTVQAEWTPAGQVAIQNANIVCKVAGLPDWSSLDIAGLNIALGAFTVIVTDTLSPNCEITFAGAATLTTTVKAQVNLSVSCALNIDAADLIFTITGTSNVSSLPSMLSGIQDVSQLSVPFSSSQLGKLSSSMLGFSIRQTANGIASYSLLSVFIVVNFDDWKGHLPSAFPTDSIDSAVIRVIVINPSESEITQVAVNIQLDLKLTDPLPPSLSVRFDAQPLLTADEYEFRLIVSAPVAQQPLQAGLTLANVTKAIGMGDVTSSIAGVLPILADILSAVQVTRLSIAVITSDSGTGSAIYTFGDWELNLYINTLTVVSNLLTITNASVQMQYVNNDFVCEGSGALMLATTDKQMEITVGFTLPTRTVPGKQLHRDLAHNTNRFKANSRSMSPVDCR